MISIISVKCKLPNYSEICICILKYYIIIGSLKKGFTDTPLTK